MLSQLRIRIIDRGDPVDPRLHASGRFIGGTHFHDGCLITNVRDFMMVPMNFRC